MPQLTGVFSPSWPVDRKNTHIEKRLKRTANANVIMWPSYQGWRTHLSLCLIRFPSRGKRWRQQPRVGGNRCLLTRSTVGHTAVPQSIINRLNTGWQCASFNHSSKIIKIEKNISISPCGLPETTYIKYRNSNSWRVSWPAQIRLWWLVAEQ